MNLKGIWGLGLLLVFMSGLVWRLGADSGPEAVERPDRAEPDTIASGPPFAVQVKDLVVPYSVMALFVLPDEEVEFEAVLQRTDSLSFEADDGRLVDSSADAWTWRAPNEPGLYPVVIRSALGVVRFHVFVQHPFLNREAVFRGYRVGAYQSEPLRGSARFLRPEGFVEVNNHTAPVKVSPSFTLGDFQSHQPGDPKYLALDERLLLKLEAILEAWNADGREAETFTVMSAFRTPWYNASIGNTTRYSLHLYGRAADIFIDEDGNGRMDDLNRNGREDTGDARILYDFIDAMKDEAWYAPFVGGLGLYAPKPHRGPFVHVDVRGFEARW